MLTLASALPDMLAGDRVYVDKRLSFLPRRHKGLVEVIGEMDEKTLPADELPDFASQWLAQRRLGFARLEELRQQALRDMSEAEAARIFSQLDPPRPYHLRPSSGLVEQQRWFGLLRGKLDVSKVEGAETSDQQAEIRKLAWGRGLQPLTELKDDPGTYGRVRELLQVDG